MPKLSKKEQHALLEVAKEVGRLCEKNKETKADHLWFCNILFWIYHLNSVIYNDTLFY